jgi:hypothetical protein
MLQVMALKRILSRSKTNAHVVCELRYAVYLLCWYKSTNTDAAAVLSDVDNRDLVEMVGEGLVEVCVCTRSVSICTFVLVKQVNCTARLSGGVLVEVRCAASVFVFLYQ